MKYRALLLAPIFACVFVAPASSQAVIDNSDMCAQLYPDATARTMDLAIPTREEHSSRDLPAANAFMAAPAGHPSLKKSRPTR
jgi:hypothetical protein